MRSPTLPRPVCAIRSSPSVSLNCAAGSTPTILRYWFAKCCRSAGHVSVCHSRTNSAASAMVASFASASRTSRRLPGDDDGGPIRKIVPRLLTPAQERLEFNRSLLASRTTRKRASSVSCESATAEATRATFLGFPRLLQAITPVYPECIASLFWGAWRCWLLRAFSTSFAASPTTAS